MEHGVPGVPGVNAQRKRSATREYSYALASATTQHHRMAVMYVRGLVPKAKNVQKRTAKVHSFLPLNRRTLCLDAI